jgi:hypothetical protein
MITPDVARDLSQTAINGYKESFDEKIENEVSKLIRRQANVGLFECEFTAESLSIPEFSPHLEFFDQLLKTKLTGFHVRRALRNKWIVSWQVSGLNEDSTPKCRCCGKRHKKPTFTDLLTPFNPLPPLPKT